MDLYLVFVNVGSIRNIYKVCFIYVEEVVLMYLVIIEDVIFLKNFLGFFLLKKIGKEIRLFSMKVKC